MNDQIKRLAKQADVTIDGMGFGEGDVELFAKLIISECVQLMNDAAYEAQDEVPTSVHQLNIARHFGFK